MPELFHHLFAEVCGQNPAHTWAPGGLPLPCCQRCTGLYVGALAGTALHLWLKPRLTSGFLWIHGAFLLQMIPFGFHWLPQGPLLRTITGILFGFGLVSFFWLLPAARRPMGEKSTEAKYFTALALSVALVLALANANSTAAAYTLTALAAAGLLTLAALVLTNLWLLVGQASRLSPSNPKAEVGVGSARPWRASSGVAPALSSHNLPEICGAKNFAGRSLRRAAENHTPEACAPRNSGLHLRSTSAFGSNLSSAAEGLALPANQTPSPETAPINASDRRDACPTDASAPSP